MVVGSKCYYFQDGLGWVFGDGDTGLEMKEDEVLEILNSEL